MPRTNHAGVTETAEFNLDPEKYREEYERIFGKKPSPFCDQCEERLSYCECNTGMEESTPVAD